MLPDREALERMSRQELISTAQDLGVRHPELMTRVELGDEILRLAERATPGIASSRGWLGVARDLLARLVERGLNLPQAAALIRGVSNEPPASRVQPPVATVTLAEIYAAQGHMARALRVLDEVLEREPDHQSARALRERLQSENERRQTDMSERARRKLEYQADARAEAAVVTVSDTSSSLFVYWELDEATRQRLTQGEPDGRAVVRVVTFQPSWEGALRGERDVFVDGVRGGTLVELPSSDTVARAALGWKAGERFRPLAVDRNVDRAGRDTPSWRPPARPAETDEALAVRARALRAYPQS